MSVHVCLLDYLKLIFYRRQLKMFAEEQEPIPKSLRTSALQDQRKLLTEKIQNWETIRLIYMPGVLQIQTDLKLNPTAIWSTNCWSIRVSLHILGRYYTYLSPIFWSFRLFPTPQLLTITEEYVFIAFYLYGHVLIIPTVSLTHRVIVRYQL